MNGKTYDNGNSSFKINQISDNKLNIYLAPFKLGSMPGDLYIDIKNIHFNKDSEGNISFQGSQDNCVYLRVGFINYQISGKYNGSIENGELRFFIEANKRILFWNIKSEVSFIGNK